MCGAVDYMPIQTADNRYVQFRYEPDYLKENLLHTISNTDAICSSLNIQPVISRIILDGGNVLREQDCVIMTDKVFAENPQYSRKELKTILQKLLEVERLVFVPQYPDDYTGHADGMLRFFDKNTVLINDHSQEDKYFNSAFKLALENAGLDYIEIPFNPYNNADDADASGVYINYLQMKNVIILPTFGMEEDTRVIKQFQNLFPDYTIESLDCREIAKDGGILNCISWNIKTQLADSLKPVPSITKAALALMNSI